MIPKVIHYCWFGRNPLPELAKKCIASWREYFPDYEIKEWNEDNFDVNMIPYTQEAYKLKKYAFVSDYARFWILYKYGGLYFDTDVEVIKPMEDIIARGAFMGREKDWERETIASLAATLKVGVNPGLGLGVNPGLTLCKEVVNYYNKHHFVSWDGRITHTVVDVVTHIIQSYKLSKVGCGILKCGDVYIYPPEFFCPLNYFTGKIEITAKTYTIHHYRASWKTKTQSFGAKIYKRLQYMSARYL